MKATDFRKMWNQDKGSWDDALTEHLQTEEGKRQLNALDDHWGEVMDVAERYGFILQAYGGTATIATHGAVIEQLGYDEAARRLRVNNPELD